MSGSLATRLIGCVLGPRASQITQVSRLLLGQGRQVADGRRRRVAGADHQDRLAGVDGPALAEHVFQAVGDVRLGGELADRRDAAVAQPAVLAVGAGAIEHDVGLLDALGFAFADQQAKGLLPASGLQ